jgi:hypothetical protein
MFCYLAFAAGIKVRLAAVGTSVCYVGRRIEDCQLSWLVEACRGGALIVTVPLGTPITLL